MSLLKLLITLIVVTLTALSYLNAVVRDRFEGQRWALPVKVFSRPIVWQPGQSLPDFQLHTQLKALGYQQTQTLQQPGQYRLIGDTVQLWTLPSIDPRAFASNRQITITRQHSRLQSIQGPTAMAQLTLGSQHLGNLYPTHQQDRELITLQQLPPSLIQGLIAIEDRQFYDHWGLSIRGIARALWANLRQGSIAQGGSTLTQQLAKNLFLSSQRTWSRKAVEAIMALMLEWHYSKHELLQAYFNEVYLAQDGHRAIHGIGLASHYYFSRPAQQLTLAQQALLLGLIKGPSFYDPLRHPQRALDRRNQVLQSMAQQQVISAEHYRQASSASLSLQRNSLHRSAPDYLDLVQRQLQAQFSTAQLQQDSLRVYTGFEPSLQTAAQQALTARLQQLAAQHQLPSLQGAMVVVRNQDGLISAVVGARSEQHSGLNRALDAYRPIGSLVKPAIYLTALQQGYHLASPLDDAPIEIQGPDGSLWQPQNYDNQSHGTPLLYQALAHSYNQATIRLGMQLGLARITTTLAQLAGTDAPPAYPSILLGAWERSPLQMAQMYYTLAQYGTYRPITTLMQITQDNQPGPAVVQRSPNPVSDPAITALVHWALQQTMQMGTGQSSQSRGLGLMLAGKTGTTDHGRDSWFAGIAGGYTAVVWIGQDDNSATPLTGSQGALQVWLDWLQTLNLAEQPVIILPDIQWHWIDTQTGQQTPSHCVHSLRVPFIVTALPEQGHHCSNGLSQTPKHRPWLLRWLSN